jgi:hypothetical protein
MLLAQNIKLMIYRMPVGWMAGEDTGDGFPWDTASRSRNF